MPFENEMVFIQLTGEQLQQFFDIVAEHGGESVGGVRFVISNGKAKNIMIDGENMISDKNYWLVTNDYSAFANIKVTTDSAAYFAAAANRRQRIIITQYHEWYGAAGGVAYIDSWTWGLDIPGFVFSKALGYNQKNVWEASSHEGGHTIGLYHQSSYDANCNWLAEYNPGGNGEAPIMGVSYNQPVGKWWVGPSTSCKTMQDDASLIASKVR